MADEGKGGTGNKTGGAGRRWRFKVFVSSVSWPRHYGLHVGEDRFGGRGEREGYPWTRVGLFLLCGHLCWFAGWELEKRDGKREVAAA